MTPQAKKRFYWIAAAVAVVLFGAGIFAGWVQRDNAICADHKPPVAQQDNGLGQIDYRCHNGQIVHK